MAIHRARMLFPFPIFGIDTDNGGGSSMRNWWHLVSKNTLLLPEDGLLRKEISAMPSQNNGAIVRQLGGYDRFAGERANATTHRTVSSTAQVCQLFATLDEAAVETA